MTERPIWAATDKQRNFIGQLLTDRDVTETSAEGIKLVIEREDLQKDQASEIISKLLELPHRPRAASGESAVGDDPFDVLQTSRFAIPVEEISPALRSLAGHSDLLFGEVREWKGFKFVNVLKGAPGQFNRTRLRGAQKFEVGRILLKDQLKYVKLYGEHYSCCGSCGAELTDETSRKLLLGPECRKKYGF